MATRTVTGTIRHADASAWSGGIVSFVLVEPFETASEVYLAEDHEVTLDAQGAFSITLGVPATGTAHYEIHTPDHASYSVYIGAGAATDLQTILTVASTNVTQDVVQDAFDDGSIATIRTITQADSVVSTDIVVRCNGTFAVTLPAATGSGVLYCIKNVGVGTITLTAAGNDLIDGAATQTINSLDRLLVLDGAADTWDILGG